MLQYMVSNTFNSYFTNLGKTLSNYIIKSNLIYKAPAPGVFFKNCFTEIIKKSDVHNVLINLKDEKPHLYVMEYWLKH